MALKLVTIERHILEQEKSFPEATGEFTQLLYDITFAAKLISREVTKAGLVDILGTTGSINVQEEEVQKLDRFANDIIIRSMNHTGRLCVMASEEEEDIIPIPERHPKGKYVLLFDPLDGSSNIDANISVGSIFSIYRKKTKGEEGSAADLLQKGRALAGAVYVIYGSSTMLVYSTGHGVHGFTLDPGIGEFLLSHPDIQIPNQGKIYSVNEGNYDFWDTGIKNYVSYLKNPDNHPGKTYSLRYIGSMVADIHRTLLYGGIFMYPADRREPVKSTGKLRLLYEASPMAYIVEQAGGRASDGYTDILDIEPKAIHQRTPLFIGSKNDVELAEDFIQENSLDQSLS